MITRVERLAVFISLAICFNAVAQNIPKGFVVPKCSLSPDGRYGVTVPILNQHEDSEEPKNSVIEVKTGRIVAVINTKFTGWNRMGHGAVWPCRWSPDGSLLLWEVDGKWFPDAVVLLKFNDGVLEWQTDITAVAEAESLKRTKRAAPDLYATAKKANAGSGSAYPEGFSIYVEAFDHPPPSLAHSRDTHIGSKGDRRFPKARILLKWDYRSTRPACGFEFPCRSRLLAPIC